MTLLADNDQRFKNLFGKAILFVLLAVIGVGGAFLWAGVKKGAFTAQSPLYFVADSGQDLSAGMPVKFSGFKIGKLTSLTLDEQGHVQVEISVETKYLKLLKKNSKLSLKKEGVIGDGVLEISHGSAEQASLAPGDQVIFKRENGLEQAVMDIKGRIEPILDDVHRMLSDPRGDVRAIMANFKQISNEISLLAKELRATRQRVDDVLANVDGNLNREVVPLLRSLKQTAGNAETMSARLEHDLPLILQKVDGSLENFRSTSELMKNAVQGVAPQLPGVMTEARATLGQTHDTLGKTLDMVGSTQEVVDSLTTVWPLRNIMPPPETAPIRMDSHD